MKKSLVLALAAVFMLGIAGTAFAAANPFSDVPADSWAYKAVAQLAKDGIIDGYPDGTFKGDKSMTRYEMAQIVYRAIQREDKTNAEQKALIDKLSAEFASELNNLGVKVDKLSDQVNNRIYLTGQVTLRYDNYNEKLQGVPQIQGTNGQKLFRTELYVNGKINDGWQYFASIRNDKTFGAVNSVQNAASISGTSASGNNYTQFRQAYVSSNLFGGYVAVGRQNNTPAYGFVASEDMTGLTVGGGGDVVTWEAFWGNTDAYWVSQQNTGSGTQWAAPFGTLYWGQNPVTWADLSVGAKLSDNLNVQVAYMNAMRSDGSSFPGFVSGNGGFDKTIGFMEAGFDWLFAPSW
ncbi:MAG: S-layer homology domain-containing protein, partial [Negativicutes bacterium]|nr:S-layer homology domain-containing protein [Negativicutes bacterium]